MPDHILIVDDDRQLTAFLERFLRKHGYQASTAGSAQELYDLCERTDFDLVVLDLNLPDEDGLEAARTMRKVCDTPIIMLTARDEVYDRIVGLELGADDYVTKPYEPHELLARIRTVLRRASRPEPVAPATEQIKFMRFGDLELDLVKLAARRISDGEDLLLTSTEFALIKALADANGDPLSRDGILQSVYGNSIAITDRAIDAHIVRLRRKLSATGFDDLVKTVHGVGYKLAETVERHSN